MTYSHALRYLTTPDKEEQSHASLGAPLLPIKAPHAPLLLCFTHNKLGNAAANLVASVLQQAGIPYLHWIDDDTWEPKRRFLIDGRPISPPILSRHAADWQAAARADGRRDWRAERCAGVLSLCAAETDCRVVLLESPLSVCHVGYFHALNKKIRAISVLSDSSEIARTAQNPATVEIITPAFGREMHSRITNICAGNDCKMVTIPASAIKRESLTLGGQTVTYTGKTGKIPYRLPSASRVAADAAALTLYALRSLSEGGLAVSEEAISKGLFGATLSHCGTVYSVEPLILTHTAGDAQELALALSDLETMSACAHAPLTVWPEPNLAPLVDMPSPYREAMWPQKKDVALLLVGSLAWIEETLALRTRKKSKNSD